MKIGFLTFNLGDFNKLLDDNFYNRLYRSRLLQSLNQMSQVDMICISTQEDSPNSRFIAWAKSVLIDLGWRSLYEIPMHSANRGLACNYTSIGNSIVSRIPFVVHLAIFVRNNRFKPIYVYESDKPDKSCMFHVIRHKKIDQGLFNTYYDKSSVVAVIEQENGPRFAIASCHFPFNKDNRAVYFSSKR